MKIRPVVKLIPPVLLILTVSGFGLAKTFLGSFGLWNDVGISHASLSGYHQISSSALSAILLSISLATISTLLAAVLGLVIAYEIHMASRFSRTLAVITGLIVVTPHLVAAVSFNFLLGDAGFLARLLHSFFPSWPQFVAGPLWLGVIFDFAWKESAFIALVLIASIPAEVRDLQFAARTMGAKLLQVATRVLLPSVKFSLIISSSLAFIYSIGSYEVTWLLGRTYPEPLANMTFRLFSKSDLSQRPAAYASAVLSIALIAFIGVTITFFLPKKSQR